MDGRAGSEDTMQDLYQYLFQPLSQPMAQNQPFQDENSSNIFTFQASNNISESINVPGNEIHDNDLNWADEMARLMVTAISYIAEAESFELNDTASSKKVTLMPTMRKWEVISMVMNKRGYNVSPQQCEDKFCDINSRYRQMTSLLGSSMSWKVAENPILLDSIDMPENQKEEVMKLLQSEQFLYLEMYSFHHGNRVFLPHDWELRSSVFSYLPSNCDETGQNQIEMGQGQNETGQTQNESKVVSAHWVELEEKSLEVQKQKLEIEKARFEWLCSKRNEELNLEKMRLEYESQMLQNARLVFELKRKEMTSVDENN